LLLIFVNVGQKAVYSKVMMQYVPLHDAEIQEAKTIGDLLLTTDVELKENILKEVTKNFGEKSVPYLRDILKYYIILQCSLN